MNTKFVKHTQDKDLYKVNIGSSNEPYWNNYNQYYTFDDILDRVLWAKANPNKNHQNWAIGVDIKPTDFAIAELIQYENFELGNKVYPSGLFDNAINMRTGQNITEICGRFTFNMNHFYKPTPEEIKKYKTILRGSKFGL